MRPKVLGLGDGFKDVWKTYIFVKMFLKITLEFCLFKNGKNWDQDSDLHPDPNPDPRPNRHSFSKDPGAHKIDQIRNHGIYN